MKPHRSSYWENANIADWDGFCERVEMVSNLNAQAAQLLEQEDTLVVSVDEKTGIQALERAAPDLPAQQGATRKREFNYIRHGTQTLIAGMEIATGQVYADVDLTRTEADYASLIKDIIQMKRASSFVFIADQLNTHKSETLVRLVAQVNGEDEPLGVKGKSGILKNMQTRMEFLERTYSGRKVRFAFTPKHCSWMNLIEVWFSGLSKRVIRQGSFCGIEDLANKLYAYIDYFNQQLAKGFNWSINTCEKVQKMIQKIKNTLNPNVTKLTG